MERIPFGIALFSVREQASGAEVTITMSEQTFSGCVLDSAKKRGLTLEETIGEALRLESLFCKTVDEPSDGLYLQTRGHLPRKLVSV